MKNIFLLIAAVMFTVSVSAHEQTKSFQQQFGTSLVQPTNAQTPLYTVNNGGIIRFIYNIFYKVGQAFSDGEETTTTTETDQ